MLMKKICTTILSLQSELRISCYYESIGSLQLHSSFIFPKKKHTLIHCKTSKNSSQLCFSLKCHKRTTLKKKTNYHQKKQSK
jgi:hypothetical protein